MYNPYVGLTRPQHLLKFLREGTPTSRHWIAELRDELSKVGQSLADIGTDEEELRRHEIEICRRAVRDAYRELRWSHSRKCYEEIIEAVRIGGFRLGEETGGETDESLQKMAWARH